MLGKLTFLPGQIRFEEGGHGDHAYLVTGGEVQITARRHKAPFQIARLGPGDLIGAMALIAARARSATATAVTDVEVIRFDRDHLESRLAETDPLVSMVLNVVLERLRDSYAQLLDFDHATCTKPAPPPAWSRASDELAILQALHIAIETDELNLVYQPIVATRTGALAGFERLIRWPHPVRGNVPPNQFIGLAERSALIFDLGEWVVERVCRDVPAFVQCDRSQHPDDFFVSINVAASQLLNAAHCTRLLDTVSRRGVEPRHLKLEVTERMYISNLIEARAAIERFKDRGISIAVDDFGTGYASLNYLQQFPVDTVKIDRSCIKDLLVDPRSVGLVRGMVALAKVVGLDVVAEGVENESVMMQLAELDCDYSQGFGISPGMPLADVMAFMRRVSHPS